MVEKTVETIIGHAHIGIVRMGAHTGARLETTDSGFAEAASRTRASGDAHEQT
jgi:hypothetical protein